MPTAQLLKIYLKKKKGSSTVSTLFIMLNLKSGDEGGEGGGRKVIYVLMLCIF